MKVTKTKPKQKIRVPREREEDAVPKKKKKVKSSSSTELTVLGSDLPKVDKKAIKTYFGKHAKGIMQMLEMNDNDGGLSLLQKKLLQTTISLVPYAEGIIRNTKSARGIYQYTTLVNQVREIMSDIRSNEDRKYVAQNLITYVIQPAFIEMAQNVITEHHEFRKVTERFVKPEHSEKFNTELKKLARRLAQNMQTGYKELEVKIVDQLKT